MVKKDLIVNVGEGLEARQIAILVQTACQFDSDVHLIYKERTVNAKSIMGVMSLGVAKGEEISLEISGADEEEALSELSDYLEGKKENN